MAAHKKPSGTRVTPRKYLVGRASAPSGTFGGQGRPPCQQVAALYFFHNKEPKAENRKQKTENFSRQALRRA
jgi:hypothetical protein